jgi:hypothetical protein
MGSHKIKEGRPVNNIPVVQPRPNGSKPVRVLTAAVLEAFEASQSQSEKVEMDIEVAPIDGWQARRCALSETRNENYSDEPALINENEPALTKEN